MMIPWVILAIRCKVTEDNVDPSMDLFFEFSKEKS